MKSPRPGSTSPIRVAAAAPRRPWPPSCPTWGPTSSTRPAETSRYQGTPSPRTARCATRGSPRPSRTSGARFSVTWTPRRDRVEHPPFRVLRRAHGAPVVVRAAPADGDEAVSAAHADRRADRAVLRLADHHGDGGLRGVVEESRRAARPVVRRPRRRHRDAGGDDLPGHLRGPGAERVAARAAVRPARRAQAGRPDAPLLADQPDTRPPRPAPVPPP